MAKKILQKQRTLPKINFINPKSPPLFSVKKVKKNLYGSFNNNIGKNNFIGNPGIGKMIAGRMVRTSIVPFIPKVKTNSVSPVNLKSYPKRTKSEQRLIDKNPWADSDKDKVPNYFDCRPQDQKKQGFIETPKPKHKGQIKTITRKHVAYLRSRGITATTKSGRPSLYHDGFFKNLEEIDYSAGRSFENPEGKKQKIKPLQGRKLIVDKGVVKGAVYYIYPSRSDREGNSWFQDTKPNEEGEVILERLDVVKGERGKNIGSAVITSLFKDPRVKYISGVSAPDSKQFYEKMGAQFDEDDLTPNNFIISREELKPRKFEKETRVPAPEALKSLPQIKEEYRQPTNEEVERARWMRNNKIIRERFISKIPNEQQQPDWIKNLADKMARSFPRDKRAMALPSKSKPKEEIWINQQNPRKEWLGDIKEKDDYGEPITDVFIDAQTKEGYWAIMTPKSFEKHGKGKLGYGYGQAYKKVTEKGKQKELDATSIPHIDYEAMDDETLKAEIEDSIKEMKKDQSKKRGLFGDKRAMVFPKKTTDSLGVLGEPLPAKSEGTGIIPTTKEQINSRINWEKANEKRFQELNKLSREELNQLGDKMGMNLRPTSTTNLTSVAREYMPFSKKDAINSIIREEARKSIIVEEVPKKDREERKAIMNMINKIQSEKSEKLWNKTGLFKDKRAMAFPKTAKEIADEKIPDKLRVEVPASGTISEIYEGTGGAEKPKRETPKETASTKVGMPQAVVSNPDLINPIQPFIQKLETLKPEKFIGDVKEKKQQIKETRKELEERDKVLAEEARRANTIFAQQVDEKHSQMVPAPYNKTVRVIWTGPEYSADLQKAEEEKRAYKEQIREERKKIEEAKKKLWEEERKIGDTKTTALKSFIEKTKEVLAQVPIQKPEKIIEFEEPKVKEPKEPKQPDYRDEIMDIPDENLSKEDWAAKGEMKAEPVEVVEDIKEQAPAQDKVEEMIESVPEPAPEPKSEPEEKGFAQELLDELNEKRKT